jgi:hypothetical protein
MPPSLLRKKVYLSDRDQQEMRELLLARGYSLSPVPCDHRRSIVSAMRKKRDGTSELPNSLNNGKELRPFSDM